MSKQVLWNKIILEEFIETASLTKEEEEVLRTHVAGWSRVKQSTSLGMSLSTIDRTIARLKKAYDNASLYNPLLPPRVRGANELFKQEI